MKRVSKSIAHRRERPTQRRGDGGRSEQYVLLCFGCTQRGGNLYMPVVGFLVLGDYRKDVYDVIVSDPPRRYEKS